jgi:hypothetical protein
MLRPSWLGVQVGMWQAEATLRRRLARPSARVAVCLSVVILWPAPVLLLSIDLYGSPLTALQSTWCCCSACQMAGIPVNNGVELLRGIETQRFRLLEPFQAARHEPILDPYRPRIQRN